MLRSPYKYFALSLLLIIIDQAIKLWVYFYMIPEFMGEIRVLGDWLKLHYVTNDGMAFGMTLDFIPGGYGKLVLSVFRLFAMVGIGYYLYKWASEGKMHQGLLWSIAAIWGGAIGNVIDSTFYGVLFDLTPPNVPIKWFHGQVIDMFYFDLWQGTLPSWLGGSYFSMPIFNFADACIFCGVVTILIYQNTFFNDKKEETLTEESTEEQISDNTENVESIDSSLGNEVIAENKTSEELEDKPEEENSKGEQ
jgi:signal peptidase II